MTENRQRAAFWVIALAAVAVAALVWLPRWNENRIYRETERLAGVAARVLPGSAVEARRKISPGMTEEKMIEAVGKPSITMTTAGSSAHGISTYYYPDGTMTVNLTDGLIARISIDSSPPRIPTSARP